MKSILINGIEVNFGQLNDWTLYSLSNFETEIKGRIAHKASDLEEYKFYLQLIELEIERQKRINAINVGADLEQAKIIKSAKKRGLNLEE